MHSLIAHITRFTPEAWALGVYVIAVFAVVGLMLGFAWVLGGRNHGRANIEPFESGVVPVGTARLRIWAKFYRVAMFFVVFDLEAVFLYAWAVSVRQSGWPGLPPPAAKPFSARLNWIQSSGGGLLIALLSAILALGAYPTPFITLVHDAGLSGG